MARSPLRIGTPRFAHPFAPARVLLVGDRVVTLDGERLRVWDEQGALLDAVELSLEGVRAVAAGPGDPVVLLGDELRLVGLDGAERARRALDVTAYCAASLGDAVLVGTAHGLLAWHPEQDRVAELQAAGVVIELAAHPDGVVAYRTDRALSNEEPMRFVVLGGEVTVAGGAGLFVQRLEPLEDPEPVDVGGPVSRFGFGAEGLVLARRDALELRPLDALHAPGRSWPWKAGPGFLSDVAVAGCRLASLSTLGRFVQLVDLDDGEALLPPQAPGAFVQTGPDRVHGDCGRSFDLVTGEVHTWRPGLLHDFHRPARVSPDGRWAVLRLGDVRLVGVADGAEVPLDGRRLAAWSPGGRLLYFSCDNEPGMNPRQAELVLREPDGSCTLLPRVPDGSADELLFDGERPAVRYGRGLAVYDGGAWQLTELGWVSVLALGRDVLATSAMLQPVTVRGRDGSVLWEAPFRGLCRLALSEALGLLAVGGDDGTVQLFELDDGAAIDRLVHAEDHRIRALHFDDAGRRLVSAAADGTVAVWPLPGRR